MNGHIAKRGGEIVVLLDEPTSLADGTPVEVKVARRKPTLDELVAGITDEKLAVMCPVTRRAKGYTFEVALPPGGIVSGVILADQLRCLSWPLPSVVFIARTPSVVIAAVMERIEALLKLPPT